MLFSWLVGSISVVPPAVMLVVTVLSSVGVAPTAAVMLPLDTDTVPALTDTVPLLIATLPDTGIEALVMLAFTVPVTGIVALLMFTVELATALAS